MFAARVCVCVYVFVCVYTYSFTINASSACNDVQGILEGMDQRSCVVSIILEKRHISPRKMNSSSRETGKKTIWYMLNSEKMTYIDIGYKSALSENRQVTIR